ALPWLSISSSLGRSQVPGLSKQRSRSRFAWLTLSVPVTPTAIAIAPTPITAIAATGAPPPFGVSFGGTGSLGGTGSFGGFGSFGGIGSFGGFASTHFFASFCQPSTASLFGGFGTAPRNFVYASSACSQSSASR